MSVNEYIVQQNLSFRTSQTSNKSEFERKIRDFFASDVEQKFGGRTPRDEPRGPEETRPRGPDAD